MIEWLLKKFKYVRELENTVLTLDRWIGELQGHVDFLKKDLVEYRKKETRFSKITLDEIETLLSSCVDYHRIVNKLNAGDSVQHRVLPIFERYGIKIERNTNADDFDLEAYKMMVGKSGD